MQYGLPAMKPKGIVIHNTNSNKSARELEAWILNSSESRGCHFLVDFNEVRQVMPLDWSCYNTGMGLDFGNTMCISIEICSNPNEARYLQGQSRAIELIKELMERFGFTENDIYFHRDFAPNINCPAQILRIYGNKQNFLRLLKGAKNGGNSKRTKAHYRDIVA